ncbi:7192_t:CDS:2, partial [Cetraspora pellucida]
LIQKCLGDDPKLVCNFFHVAEEHASYIVFIDEIHAIGTKQITLLDDVDLKEFVISRDDLSVTDIKVCLLYERRMKVIAEDFRKGCEKVLYRKSEARIPIIE